jgi:putative alpha-1,2-mannosidase
MAVSRVRLPGGLKVRAFCCSLLNQFRKVTFCIGDMWAYSFDVVHNIPRLIQERGGNASFVQSLDEHFDGGHNDHTNEVRSLRGGGSTV